MDIGSYRQAARTYIHSSGSKDRRSHATHRLLNVDYAKLTLQDLVQSLDLKESRQSLRDEEDFFRLLEGSILLEDYLIHLVQQDSLQDVPVNIVVGLREYLAKVLLPPPIFAERSPYCTDTPSYLTPQKTTNFQATSYHVLLCLSLLQASNRSIADEALILYYTSLAAYTDQEDPWTSHDNCTQAVGLINRLRDIQDRESFSKTLGLLLQEHVKPSFARMQNPKLTEQGRKLAAPPQSTFIRRDEDADSKRWKYDCVYATTLLRFVLRQLGNTDPHFIEANWPLIIPPILTLIDDSSIKYKTAGCDDLLTLLHYVPTAIINRTGLGEVFQDAMLPCLLYLPPLTGEIDSINLLNRAYPALIKLARVRFPGSESRSSVTNFLDRIMRYGIFKGIANAAEQVRIVETLMIQAGILVEELGMDTVKHMKHIVRMCTVNLVNPFGTMYPPLQLASLRLLRQTLNFGWPVGRCYESEILKGLIVCWLRLENEENTVNQEKSICWETNMVIRTLFAISGRDADLHDGIHLLVQSDPRLKKLFKSSAEA